MGFIRYGLNILVEGRIRDGGLDLTKLCHLLLVSGSHNNVARYSDKAPCGSGCTGTSRDLTPLPERTLTAGLVGPRWKADSVHFVPPLSTIIAAAAA